MIQKFEEEEKENQIILKQKERKLYSHNYKAHSIEKRIQDIEK
jgi:hypothetical protein